MIHCSQLTKTINNTNILKGVSFSLDKGATLGVLGPNGAGKSTTLKILATLLKPTSGELIVDGINVLEQPSLIRKKISYLPETPPLYPELTVKEYVRTFGELKGSNNLEEELEINLKRCRIKEVENSFCGNLSKGFRQKVALAASLMGKPSILLLDEPTSGLDPKEIVEIRSLIRSLKDSHTILFSSHILSEVSEICDQVVIFVGGRTMRQASLEELEKQGGLENVFLKILDSSSHNS